MKNQLTKLRTMAVWMLCIVGMCLSSPVSAQVQLIDLGLSVKWADRNIDATASSGTGGYYAWGETFTKSTYSWATYKYCSGTAASCTNIGSNIAKNKTYDRAYAYKTTMCLPTAAQWDELITKCTWTAATVSNVKGYNVKGTNGKTIFLPFSGCSYDGKDYGSGSYGYYWSANNVSSDASKAQAAYVKASTKTTVANLNRRTGCAIRAVSVETTGTGDDPTTTTTIELIDLGLSVKWANMNIDATASSGKGGYYAWGETYTKSTYSWETYKYCSGTAASCTDIGTTIAKKSGYDRAYGVKNTMCLPTAAQWDELITKCTWTETTVNNVKGYNVKGTNGKTIFLPFSGCSYDGNDYGSGSYGYYWSANNVSTDVSKAKAAYVKAGTKISVPNLNRRTGCAIRAVSVATTGTGDDPTPTTTIELIDLGLSVKWANMNIDAMATSGQGGYYAWGETYTKSTYSWETYKYCSGTAASCTNIGTSIAKKSSYDRAYAYKTTMCLPTATQWNELISKCTWTAATVNSVKGYNVKGPSGKTIFLPFSGCSYDGKDYGSGSYGYYWSANNVSSDVSKAQAAYVKASTKTTVANLNRRTGCAIRAVSVATTGTGDDPTPTTTIELIDLGLSVKWANMNIDATATSDKGGYYAWGETATKSTYSWATYKHCSGTAASCTNIGTTIAKNKTYDRAYAYKTTMCLPTATQWNELISKCTWTAATVSSVKGYNVKGPSGKTIFLPLSGCSYDGKDYGSGSYGYYWSANNVSSDVSKAQAAYVKASTKTTVANLNRRTGCAIRAVSVATTGSGNDPTPTTIELVDLGLSVKWANMNIDATTTSGKGGYYAWGETATKSTYSWATYKHCSGTAASCTNIGTTIAKKSSYDRAYAYNTTMCLPTAAQWNELITKCTWTAATVNNVKGYNVNGPSGKTIFLPFSGCSYDGKDYGNGSYGYYWSANNVGSDVSKAQAAYVKASTKTTVTNLNRRTGCAIRAVSVEQSSGGSMESYLTCPDENHPHLIDLGLPSGVKWACCNVDTYSFKQSPTNYGSYYSWGETEEKDFYFWSTYIHCDGTRDTCHDLGSDITGTQYDVAHVKWGGSWVMPSFGQFRELVNNTTSKWTTLNGIYGRLFTGPNGGSIFLPAAGRRYGDNESDVGRVGFYWHSTQYQYDSYEAYCWYFHSDGNIYLSNRDRREGYSVRPVAK